MLDKPWAGADNASTSGIPAFFVRENSYEQSTLASIRAGDGITVDMRFSNNRAERCEGSSPSQPTARVVELADTPALKPGVRTHMRVRVPPWALHEVLQSTIDRLLRKTNVHATTNSRARS